MTARKTLGELERMAEGSYSAMYEARPHNVKDHYDDAQLYDDVTRLTNVETTSQPFTTASFWASVGS